MPMKAAQLGSPGTPEWALHGGTAWMTLCLWRPCVTTEIPGETGRLHCALWLQACHATAHASRVHCLAERLSLSCLWPRIGQLCTGSKLVVHCLKPAVCCARDGSLVHINYAAQFSGEKPPAAEGGGFQGAKRGRKAKRAAAGAQGGGAAQREESWEGAPQGSRWMTGNQNRHRKKAGHAGGPRHSLNETEGWRFKSRRQ